jgi:hypothetical protein
LHYQLHQMNLQLNSKVHQLHFELHYQLRHINLQLNSKAYSLHFELYDQLIMLTCSSIWRYIICILSCIHSSFKWICNSIRRRIICFRVVWAASHINLQFNSKMHQLHFKLYKQLLIFTCGSIWIYIICFRVALEVPPNELAA